MLIDIGAIGYRVLAAFGHDDEDGLDDGSHLHFEDLPVIAFRLDENYQIEPLTIRGPLQSLPDLTAWLLIAPDGQCAEMAIWPCESVEAFRETAIAGRDEILEIRRRMSAAGL